jgi:pyruvate,water dikinase
MVALTGGKASGLVKLIKMGRGRFNVPPFFVARAGLDLTGEGKQNTLMQQIDEALDDLKDQMGIVHNSEKVSFAVRSSCMTEDQQHGSFAGQFDSFLSVARQDVLSKIKAVVEASTTKRAQAYKTLVKLNAGQNEMAVLVQVMIDPLVAGVMFSADPVGMTRAAKDTVVISAVDGLADKLMQGQEDGEHITVCNGEIRRSGNSAAIENETLLRLALIAKELEKLYGFEVDVEWALAESKIYILQVRPVTTVREWGESGSRGGAATEQLRIFDGSNIQESYPGITTPMTFSFIRRAYKEVYRSFVRLMGVSDAVIEQNEDIFSGMLGYVDGHVYYNLGNWYRLLALMPAYQTNRQFMEKMMGLKEPALAVSPVRGKHSLSNFRARLNTTIALAHIAGEYLGLEKSKSRFSRRLSRAVDLDRSQLKDMHLDALCRLYRSLEMDLLTKWDAPIVNDFFAMIFFGVYQKLNSDTASYHSLIEGLGNVISAQPPRMIKAIASLIQDDKALIRDLIKNPQAPYVEQRFQSHRKAYKLYQEYLSQFGDRAIGELKLESQSVRENPALLLATIGAVAAASGQAQKVRLQIAGPNSEVHAENQSSSTVKPNGKSDAISLIAAIKTAVAQLSDPAGLVKKMLLPYIGARTRELIAGRENLRFARTRVFGLVRDIMLTIATKLVEQNKIDDRQDIFYLEVEEVLNFIEGASTCNNLRGLIALRRAEETKYQSNLPDRITVTGPVGLLDMKSESCQRERAEAEVKAELEKDPTVKANGNAGHGLDASGKEVIKGLPACSGKRQGLARVIADPTREHLLEGEIMVAERTDPGWIMHFALSRAIVTSYGSMLSHTAIVARELKIPAVVAAKGATEKICTGDLIEVDGTLGTVTIISKAQPQEAFSQAARARACA